MKIEPGKIYRTRGGQKARIYATDGAGDYPVHGAILRENGWSSVDWTDDGRDWHNPNRSSPDDLISEWREPMKFEGCVLMKRDRSNKIVFDRISAARDYLKMLEDDYVLIPVSGTEEDINEEIQA